MLVRCPQCRTEFRLVDIGSDERVVKYLCPGCETIVRIDLTLDEVASSSSSGSYRSVRRRSTVLIAEDSESVQGEAEAILTRAGYQVLLASDGVEALKTIREQHPDLVLLDLLMPRMTGFDVLREMSQDERVKGTPVLAMSGVYKESVIGFLHQLGARGFLDKQQLKDSLLSRVQLILGGSSGT